MSKYSAPWVVAWPSAFALAMAAAVWPTGVAATVASSASYTNWLALHSQGQYWLERQRLDLAAQSYNRILLMDPENASALRWQGLIELRRGEVQAAQLWYKRLLAVHGATHPAVRELAQCIELATTQRQRLAELKFQWNSPKADRSKLLAKLTGILGEPLMGDAALQVYRIMGDTPEGRSAARVGLQQLQNQYPQDTRYASALAALAPAPAVLAARGNAVGRASPSGSRNEPEQQTQAQEASTPQADPQPSAFEQGDSLANQADALAKAGQLREAIGLLDKAVVLNPDYPWFRFNLAGVLIDAGEPADLSRARTVMDQGLALNEGREMWFASALIATRLGRTDQALALMEAVPRTDWTDGMSALDKRIRYGEYRAQLARMQDEGQYNAMGRLLSQPTPWRAEPEVVQAREELTRRVVPRVRMAYDEATIAGSPGVSGIRSREIPVQIEWGLDFEKTAFVRLDQLEARAGTVDVPQSANFAQLGTTTANDPTIRQNLLSQNFKGQVLGVGVQTGALRLDVGSTVGDLPVNSWVGGVQWRQSIGDGSLRLELARRMVSGSVLSSTGAIDPLTGQAWGGARRNGVSAVYYTPVTSTLDFVGIARANVITGRHIPDNRELNLQGILSKTVFQRPGHKVELGASLFLWSFQRNLRFYTYGQGGYYSPQAFASLTFPVTWTGRTQAWSWRVQAGVGASESREDPTDLYPLDPQLALAAAAQGNAVRNAGGPGGGISTSLRASIEHQLTPAWAVGASGEIDRSEGYNPDRLSVYMKFSLGDRFEFSAPPESVTPYSRF